MSQPDLNSLRARILRHYGQDGSFEITAAVLLPVLVPLFSAEQPGVHGMLVAILAAGLLIIGAKFWRQRFVYPRLGFAELIEGRARQRADVFRQSMQIVLWIVLLGVPLRVLANTLNAIGLFRTPEALALAQIGSMLTSLIIAFNLTGPRSWYIAFLGAGLYIYCIGSGMLGVPAPWHVLIPSAVLAGLGLIRLRRFLRENPKLETEEVP